MSKHAAPKHRALAPRRGEGQTPENLRRGERGGITKRLLALSAIAGGVTAAAVAGGLATSGDEIQRTPVAALTGGVTGEGSTTAAAPAPLAAPAKLTSEERAELRESRGATAVSRSDTRASSDPAKESSLEVSAGEAETRTETLSDEDPRTIGRALLGEFGYGEDQWGCLDSLWTKESNWNVYADNPTSSAYGIPQSLPGSKMASAGPDWETNPVTQIRWGLGYIQSRYGTPCAAWGHSQARNWY